MLGTFLGIMEDMLKGGGAALLARNLQPSRGGEYTLLTQGGKGDKSDKPASSTNGSAQEARIAADRDIRPEGLCEMVWMCD